MYRTTARTCLALAALVLGGCGASNESGVTSSQSANQGASTQQTTTTAGSVQKVTLAQFGHVFLYMPLYVAIDRGFFKEQGLEVNLVSTGGDEKTFTAVATGNRAR
jgi:ABC-type nitrate/sulfonate/bicarbonate transport system substrate-binding protein